MSDDLFTLDLSGMDLKDLIQVVNELDSKLNSKIIPEILEEMCIRDSVLAGHAAQRGGISSLPCSGYAKKMCIRDRN